MIVTCETPIKRINITNAKIINKMFNNLKFIKYILPLNNIK